MNKYYPQECKESIKLYGFYLCRLNGGVPCALYIDKKCYKQKSDEAVVAMAKAIMRDEETE